MESKKVLYRDMWGYRCTIIGIREPTVTAQWLSIQCLNSGVISETLYDDFFKYYTYKDRHLQMPNVGDRVVYTTDCRLLSAYIIPERNAGLERTVSRIDAERVIRYVCRL